MLKDLQSDVLIDFIESLCTLESDSSIPTGLGYVKWILKGQRSLKFTRITIDGLEHADPCIETIHKTDTLVYLLEQIT